MAKDKVMIYCKNIQFKVVLPNNMVWPFAQEFGKKFALKADTPKPIDGYSSLGDCFTVQVSVHILKEQEFYEFLGSFCLRHKLPVRKEDLQPGKHGL